MREIKFRAWDVWDKKIIDWKEIYYNKTFNYDFYMGVTGNLIPMQYTGLKDKNGKEIFEGDVVKWFSCRVEKAIVQFSNGIFQLKIQEPENDDYYMDILYNWTSTIEVVGNIYQHKHLLDNTDTRTLNY